MEFAAGVTAIEVNLGKDVTTGVVDTGSNNTGSQLASGGVSTSGKLAR
jgi:hypothetical protein